MCDKLKSVVDVRQGVSGRVQVVDSWRDGVSVRWLRQPHIRTLVSLAAQFRRLIVSFLSSVCICVMCDAWLTWPLQVQSVTRTGALPVRAVALQNVIWRAASAPRVAAHAVDSPCFACHLPHHNMCVCICMCIRVCVTVCPSRVRVGSRVPCGAGRQLICRSQEAAHWWLAHS